MEIFTHENLLLQMEFYAAVRKAFFYVYVSESCCKYALQCPLRSNEACSLWTKTEELLLRLIFRFVE